MFKHTQKTAWQLNRKTIRMLLSHVVPAFVLLSNSACSIFGVESVEEAPYQVILNYDPYEVREYSPVLVAETRVKANFKEAGSLAFRKLFAYISGDNETAQEIAMTAPVIADSASKNGTGENIAMTAPVISSLDGDEWRYRFVLPQDYSIETAPRPTNPDVVIIAIPSKLIATLRYSGRATTKQRTLKAKQLDVWIREEGLVSKSSPKWAGYNAPWTIPWFRRNEVLIDVEFPQ